MREKLRQMTLIFVTLHETSIKCKTGPSKKGDLLLKTYLITSIFANIFFWGLKAKCIVKALCKNSVSVGGGNIEWNKRNARREFGDAHHYLQMIDQSRWSAC